MLAATWAAEILAWKYFLLELKVPELKFQILGYPAISSRPDLAKQVRELDLAVDQLLTSGNLESTEIPKAMQPRLPHTVVLSVGGWVNGAPSLEIQFYDLNANAWAQVQHINFST
jgi:hypothetical protein